ncbi:monosaccharide ABC transporter substrate-binding protein (CUT2 family) [Hydrogenispora ethanolica]|jgi:ribose transport system substrate-binding protein|uniref:Monosaccharide ABC transporter substrate-binding protein (CUT2 family) n=1 Tax=Hydrogenispora ethanolica TaxID=1082276 RepID=A0A4R1RIN4_HYDET|nr:substrate-binding domain-containing protein [Hydrogenispora ethanolica]TCL65968.1 monosaccharide ABC transporter substrate-binding protein (CUT2 family) [Hydrogenispora ethanolica]
MRTTLIVALISLIMIAVALTLVTQTVGYFGDEAEALNSQKYQNYRYHFVMIAHVTEESYWRQVLAGSAELCRSQKIALENYGPRFMNPKELERFLEMAVLSSVDGILVAAPNDPTLKSLVEEAMAKDIPVVALSNHLETSGRISFVGTSTYDLGYKTGQALGQAATGPIRAALLVNSNFSENGSRNYLRGFEAAIRNRPELSISLVVNSKGESISAEDQTQSILKNHPEIQAIICSDPNDTLGVAKLVVDLNQVSRITIIGYGLTSEIANYIRRGVIAGVLADDPGALGVQGLSALIRLKEGQSTQEVYNMPLYLINAKNVDSFYRQFNLAESR